MHRVRLYTCFVIVSISLVGFMCTVVILMHHVNCIGDNYGAGCWSLQTRKLNDTLRADGLIKVVQHYTNAVDDNSNNVKRWISDDSNNYVALQSGIRQTLEDIPVKGKKFMKLLQPFDENSKHPNLINDNNNAAAQSRHKQTLDDITLKEQKIMKLIQPFMDENSKQPNIIGGKNSAGFQSRWWQTSHAFPLKEGKFVKFFQPSNTESDESLKRLKISGDNKNATPESRERQIPNDIKLNEEKFIKVFEPSYTANTENFKLPNIRGDNRRTTLQSLQRKMFDDVPLKGEEFIKFLQVSTSPVQNNFKSWKPVVMININPNHWPGEMGKAVVIPPEEEELQKEKFVINQFNLLASDRIALNRTVPDIRTEGCKKKRYASRLPSTSIVIVFHNEAWSTLLRTVHSIIRMSPSELVEEIILVDDASERDYLGRQLEEYVSKLPVSTKVLRTGKRSGLIRARLLGATAVKGQVITFLDAHCECTIGWLEPLLDRIAEDRTRVVCPVIDSITPDTFSYVPADEMTWGGFNWMLSFRWYKVPRREDDRRNGDRTQPLRTPTMAGGLFSIDKEYFEEIGKYDEGMEIWGGENLELSFRVWMCGGTLEIMPCSHVGHVFRQNTPYTYPGGSTQIINRNKARLAEVWMDEWKGFFYAINPVAKNVGAGNVTQRKELREKLHCKNFRWYLENIYPESQMPLHYYHIGEIRNEITNKCLDTYSSNIPHKVVVTDCLGVGQNQIFVYTKRKQIMSDDKCLYALTDTNAVQFLPCDILTDNYQWEYDEQDKTILHVNSGRCLDKSGEENSTSLLLNECDKRASQAWIMKEIIKWNLS